MLYIIHKLISKINFKIIYWMKLLLKLIILKGNKFIIAFETPRKHFNFL